MSRLIIALFFICTAMAGMVSAAERPQRIVPGGGGTLMPAPAVLSIVPAQTEPGGKVMVYGTGFGETPKVFLGSVEASSRTIDGKQIEFTVPGQMSPGLYALYLKRLDGPVSRPYNFTVLPLRPVLSGLSPDQISACAQGRDRDVTLQGQNFTENSLVLFDGAALKSRFISSETIIFSVPRVAGGLHRVQVSNQPDNSTLPMALTVDTRPEISSVTMGSEHVNYYELIIDGRNFQTNASILVDGQRIGGSDVQGFAEREKLLYQDCNRLIYQRHPYSPVNKDFHIQVVNPGGEASQMVNVTAP